MKIMPLPQFEADADPERRSALTVAEQAARLQKPSTIVVKPSLVGLAGCLLNMLRRLGVSIGSSALPHPMRLAQWSLSCARMTLCVAWCSALGAKLPLTLSVFCLLYVASVPQHIGVPCRLPLLSLLRASWHGCSAVGGV